MPSDEQVLVIERTVLDELGSFQGLSLDVERYVARFFSEGVPRFMERGQAEIDPAFKQLIPYVVMCCDGQFLTYVRGKRSGETRLVGQRSIGIGGHVNPIDDMPLYSHADKDEMLRTYEEAVRREVAEEVAVESGHTDRIVALLNDDSTEVGQVHLGIVHFWNLEAPNVSRREQMITQLAFMDRSDLLQRREEMESWSQFCLDHLAAVVQLGTRSGGRTMRGAPDRST